MKRLTRAILDDYAIERAEPQRLCAVQFGDDPLLMGLVDRLIDDANRRGANVGVAVVQPGEQGHAQALAEQDGLFNGVRARRTRRAGAFSASRSCSACCARSIPLRTTAR